jgi:SHS2 domain-containing protein
LARSRVGVYSLGLRVIGIHPTEKKGGAAQSMAKEYEIIDHTADLGIRVFGNNLQELFESAGEAFFDLVTDAQGIQAKEERVIEVEGNGLAELMNQWLNELLFLLDTQGLLFREFDTEVVNSHHLRVKAKGEVFREEVHERRTEIKGVTYHQLDVRKQNNKWMAQVIFDI